MSRWERRQFLRYAGALGASTMASLLEPAHADPARPEQAPASDTSRPMKFVGVFTPHGCAYELWKPGEGFNLNYPGCSLSPFDDPDLVGVSLKPYLTVIDGLDLAAGIEVGTVGHDASRVILTGSGVVGKNASLDQYLASERLLGADTPFTSLVLAVGNDKTDLGANISYARGGTPIPKWIDPVQIFDELFGQPLTEQSRRELQALRQRKASVLDFVKADLGKLRLRAPRTERIKLEQHASALREIEKRLSPVERQCHAPSRPDPRQFPKLRSYGAGEPYFETITQLQIDLLARALSCDLTRFATLMLADLSRTGLYPELPTDCHAGVAHPYQARTAKGPGKPETWKNLALQNRHSHLQVARLMKGLVDASALDDTTILVQSDMGDPARHSSRNVPTLLAGGSGGKFKMGRYVDLRSGKGGSLAPNNHLLVSIARAFGVPLMRFGHSASAATMTGDLDAQL